MKYATNKLVMLFALVFLAGCIIGDDLSTVTVRPDGSAELVTLRSNLHSTEKGDKAVNEIAEYQASFDSRSDEEFARVRDAGGSIVATSWIRKEAPSANLFHARFPSAAALEKYWTMRNDDGRSAVTPEFHTDGVHRRLTIRVTMPQDAIASVPVDLGAFQRSQANGISMTRIAIEKGTITGARGFTIADDKESAVLSITEMAGALRDGDGTAEIYLEWDVGP